MEVASDQRARRLRADAAQRPCLIVVKELGAGVEQFGHTTLYFTTKDNVKAQVQKILSGFDRNLRELENWR